MPDLNGLAFFSKIHGFLRSGLHSTLAKFNEIRMPEKQGIATA